MRANCLDILSQRANMVCLRTSKMRPMAGECSRRRAAAPRTWPIRRRDASGARGRQQEGAFDGGVGAGPAAGEGEAMEAPVEGARQRRRREREAVAAVAADGERQRV